MANNSWDIPRQQRPDFKDRPEWVQKKIIEDDNMRFKSSAAPVVPDGPSADAGLWDAMPLKSEKSAPKVDRQKASDFKKGFFGE